MLNSSALDSNSTLTAAVNCLYGIHWGMVVANVATFFCFVLGTPAQCWLLWLSLQDGWKIKPTQMFPLIMNILELIYSIQCSTELILLIVPNNHTFWIILYIICGFFWVGRPLIQICICVEQYLAVCHPIMFLKYKALQYRIVFAAVVWLMSAACAVFQASFSYFTSPIFTYIFVISVIIILFCCVSVLRALNQPLPGDTQITVERGRDVGNQQKRKAFNTIFTGLLIILITYLPQVSLSLFNEKHIGTELLYCNIVAFMNTFVVLGILITPFLKIYKKVNMKCLKHRREFTLNS